MQVIIDLQNANDSENLPGLNEIQSWILVALDKAQAKFEQPEITIRIVSLEESQQLNSEYRGKDKPTNVLSFPFEPPEMIPIEELGEFLGDLVICEEIIIQEATEQQKTPQSHWAHLVIHGLFHLLGFDHIEEVDAEEMETLEIEVMKELGFGNPY